MSDPVSRQAAIDAKQEFRNPNVVRNTEARTAYDRTYANGWNDCNSAWINAIKALPSAQPETHDKRTETHACDLIDRQAAQTELMMKCERYTLARESHGMGHVEWSSDLISVADAMDAIRGLPSAQPQRNPDEWCHDCKEYDQERNCCPRFNQVIRQTLSEQTEVIRCKECINNRNCDIQYYAQAGDEFWCAAAERRTE